MAQSNLTGRLSMMFGSAPPLPLPPFVTAALLWAVLRIACFGALLATGVHKRRVLAGVLAQAAMRATPTSPTQTAQFAQLTPL